MGRYLKNRFTDVCREVKERGTGDAKLPKIAEVLMKNSDSDKATLNREFAKAGLSPMTIGKVFEALR